MFSAKIVDDMPRIPFGMFSTKNVSTKISLYIEIFWMYLCIFKHNINGILNIVDFLITFVERM